MIAVVENTDGDFNVFGTRDESFCLQGNLTLAELKELHEKIFEVLVEKEGS